MDNPNFPPEFLWGCATSALQIEGSLEADGRARSIWDDFCRDYPERIHGGASPEPACDHYRRWEEDLDWIARLGHNAYRFSIAWPRVQSPAGLDFYDRLVDGLCRRGIQPLATLYHWDLPSALGSWDEAATVEAFADYAQLCAARLGDRVSHWMTLNEPAWSLMNGYVTGLHPPAVHDLRRAFQAAHHQILAHHRAVEVLRSGVRGQIGIALNLSPVRCAGATAKDRRAARWADGFLNRWFLGSVIEGAYPSELAGLLRRTLGWEAEIAEPQPLDFLGVNYYYPKWVKGSDRPTSFALNTSGNAADRCHFSLENRMMFVSPPGSQKTEWDWEIDPQGLLELLVELHRRHPGLPLIVTENGIGLREEWADRFDDRERMEFVGAHLRAVQQALRENVPVRGYLMWSLMDNFSWLNGYQKRYGLLAVHPETLERRPKASAEWFRRVFQNEVPL
jgi:6-phospho-beta-glucosidase